MCGILGTIALDRHFQSRVEFEASLSKLKHRGPDDFGTMMSSVGKWKILIGQTRLSIIDLTSGGHQPYASLDGRYSLVFNGEIYNYKELRSYLKNFGYNFFTDSDTEVLLNAWIHWGAGCLSRIRGMFAFAVLDSKENKITLVRDAFGIKPLYYFINQQHFAFASEISALQSIIPIKLKSNNQNLYNYIAYGRYDFGSQTFFDEIKNLESGHILTVDLSGKFLNANVSRWWWPEVSEDKVLTRSDAISELREKFLDNIKLHLISDVPIGAALSGGLDSSAIVCAMRYLNPDMEIKTFSYIAGGSEKNEESWVDLVNKHVGATSHKVILEKGDLVKDLDDMIKFQGEPFGSTSIYAQYRIFKLAQEKGVTVTLDGQGADELFGGYDGYPEWKIRTLIYEGNYVEAIKFLRRWSKEPSRSLSEGFVKTVAVNIPEYLIPFSKIISRKRIPRKIINISEANSCGIITNYPLRTTNKITRKRSLAGRLRHALTEGDLNQLLRHGDRNSMRWSIESRVPFLTTDLAEFVLHLPEESLVSNEGVTKKIFRDAMTGIVPDAIIHRTDKIGFETPDLAWFTISDLEKKNWLDGLELIPWIDIDQAKKLFNEVFSDESKDSLTAWRLINASKWIQFAADSDWR